MILESYSWQGCGFPLSRGALLVLGDNWRGLWVLWSFILFAVFQLTLAEVKAEPDGFRYRRLLKWGIIRYDEIAECGTGWPPFGGA